MRLENEGFFRGQNYRVVLDYVIESTNYIERTRGVYYNEDSGNHTCLKCGSEVLWNEWPTNNTAKNECGCGKLATLEILEFKNKAIRR